jgi:hypothetical protein
MLVPYVEQFQDVRDRVNIMTSRENFAIPT